MGHHYVPQAHLRRFQIADNPGRIWMYDKQDHVWRVVSIKKAAQNAQYYADDVEASLANEVEAPGNKIVGKILRNEEFTSDERFCLAQYLSIMATRGPRQRRKTLASLPKIVESTTTRLRLELGLMRTRKNIDRVDARLEEIDKLREKYKVSPPQTLIDQARVPFTSFDMVKSICDMAWHFVRSSDHHFITGDTPAHFFESIGTCKTQSEYTFTVSRNLAFVGENQTAPRKLYFHDALNSDFVDQINQRLVSHVERFAFSDSKRDDIAAMVESDSLVDTLLPWNTTVI